MVVHDLDVFSACGRPAEAETVLVVDTDAMLTRAVALEYFEPVPRGHAKVVEPPRDLQLPEFAPGDGLDGGESLDPRSARKPLGLGVRERDDHGRIVTRCVINVNRTDWIPLSRRTECVKNEGLWWRAIVDAVHAGD
jgi:hypothetical protein